MSMCTDPTGFKFTSPHAAVDAMIACVEAVSSDRIALSDAAGRVLAESVSADRDSPPADVSAMDGYVVRMEDVKAMGRLPVTNTVVMGKRPPVMPAGRALRIATGACVPAGADAVIPREWLDESPESIAWSDRPRELRQGQNIRRRGENLRAGQPVASPGQLINAAVAGALAGFGVMRPRVFRKVDLAVLTTGDEVLRPTSQPTDWQIRNSNGPAICAFLRTLPWVGRVDHAHVPDSAEGVADAMRASLEKCDGLITTGGVSMGDRDFIPPAIQTIGGETIYHKLPMRPGKPNLGTVSACGKPILALPGNPVAVLVGLHVLVEPVLRRLAGFETLRQQHAVVSLEAADDKRLPLWWYRQAEWVGDGRVRLVANKGSGDFASAAGASGFIEIRPGDGGEGPWPFYDA